MEDTIAEISAADGDAGATVGVGGTVAPWDAEDLDGVAFVGSTLAPLFLYEPRDGRCAPVVRALAALDVDGAAESWPFAGERGAGGAGDAAGFAVRGALEALVRGAACEVELAGAAGGRNGGEDGGPGAGASPAEAAPVGPAGPSPLVKAYRRLFEGPAALMAPPWGSVYTDRDCVVFGLSTLALREWMRANGIVMETGERVPEDHMGLMLQQMAFVAENRPELLDEFLREHLLTWSSHYLELLAGASRRGGEAGRAGDLPLAEEDAVAFGFYGGLADLTRVTLEGMRSLRGLDVQYPRFYR